VSGLGTTLGPAGGLVSAPGSGRSWRNAARSASPCGTG